MNKSNIDSENWTYFEFKLSLIDICLRLGGSRIMSRVSLCHEHMSINVIKDINIVLIGRQISSQININRGILFNMRKSKK